MARLKTTKTSSAARATQGVKTLARKGLKTKKTTIPLKSRAKESNTEQKEEESDDDEKTESDNDSKEGEGEEDEVKEESEEGKPRKKVRHSRIYNGRRNVDRVRRERERLLVGKAQRRRLHIASINYLADHGGCSYFRMPTADDQDKGQLRFSGITEMALDMIQTSIEKEIGIWFTNAMELRYDELTDGEKVSMMKKKKRPVLTLKTTNLMTAIRHHLRAVNPGVLEIRKDLKHHLRVAETAMAAHKKHPKDKKALAMARFECAAEPEPCVA